MLYALGLASMALAWLRPGHYFPWAGFQQEALAGCGALLIALAASVTVRRWTPGTSLLAVVSALLAAVPLLQWSAGMLPYLSDALVPSVYLLALALMVISGFQLAMHEKHFVPALFATFYLGAFTSAAFAIAQSLQWGPFTFIQALVPGDRASANFIQPNHLATLLGLGIAAVLWAYESRRIAGMLAAAAVSPLLLGLTLTRSRVGWLFGLCFVLLWLFYRRRLSLRTSAAAVLGGVLGFVALVLLWAPLSSVLTGAEGATVAARVQAGDRWVHLQTLWDAAWRSPWVGYGWNQVSAAQQAAVLDHPPTFEWLSSSHNLLLDLVVWNGLPLGLLVIGVVGWWAVRRVRDCINVDAFALIAALSVLFAHSMVEFPLTYAYYLLPAGLLAGALEARTVQPDARSSKVPWRAGHAVASLVVVAFSWLICSDYLEIEEAVRQVRMRDAGYAQRAFVPGVRWLDGPREYVRLWVTKNDDGDPGSDMAWLRTVTLRYATPPALLRYAVATAQRGQREESVRTLSILCRISQPKFCDQGREHWAQLAKRYPGVGSVRYPDTPSR
jgi:hypothetical protein